jgi:hypothetical protein
LGGRYRGFCWCQQMGSWKCCCNTSRMTHVQSLLSGLNPPSKLVRCNWFKNKISYFWTQVSLCQCMQTWDLTKNASSQDNIHGGNENFSEDILVTDVPCSFSKVTQALVCIVPMFAQASWSLQNLKNPWHPIFNLSQW